MTEFDPTQHTVAEVQEYLTSAAPDEFQRVLEAEQAGKARQGVLEFSPPAEARAEAVEADPDGYTRRPVGDAYQPGPPLEA